MYATVHLHISHTHTNKDTTYKQPSTMAACETEACSPLVSFNINGFPDRSAGGTGREKTRQIAGGDRFSVELLKYAPYQNAKQLKGNISAGGPRTAQRSTLSEKPLPPHLSPSFTFLASLHHSLFSFPLSMLSFSWRFVSFLLPFLVFSPLFLYLILRHILLSIP